MDHRDTTALAAPNLNVNSNRRPFATILTPHIYVATATKLCVVSGQCPTLPSPILAPFLFLLSYYGVLH